MLIKKNYIFTTMRSYAMAYSLKCVEYKIKHASVLSVFFMITCFTLLATNNGIIHFANFCSVLK